MSERLRVLLVTSWGTPCGIAEHSALLKASVEGADPTIEVLPSAAALDPAALRSIEGIDLVHLNHHDGLHSRWTAEYVQQLRAQGVPVVVTYHDTRERLADCPKLESFAQQADATIIHEPIDLIRSYSRLHYWRQGVPAAAVNPVEYHATWQRNSQAAGWTYFHEACIKAFPQQPVLGTVGFNFPWKNYDRLAQLTGEEGWALVILSHNATVEEEARWRASNPSILVVRTFLPQDATVNYLAGCDATAFMYECANTGTSGAIRQGIAARKPVIALSTCRQFRDLLAIDAIDWVHDWSELRVLLHGMVPTRVDPQIHALAEQDSWTRLGAKYAQLYRQVAAR